MSQLRGWKSYLWWKSRVRGGRDATIQPGEWGPHERELIERVGRIRADLPEGKRTGQPENKATIGSCGMRQRGRWWRRPCCWLRSSIDPSSCKSSALVFSWPPGSHLIRNSTNPSPGPFAVLEIQSFEVTTTRWPTAASWPRGADQRNKELK